jgi:molecular chaperone DnaJ
MSESVNHYAALNLPPTADLVGVENAYARISNELAMQTWVDDTAAEALVRVNEAYAILSRPEMRRDYDASLFVREREHLAVQRRRTERQHRTRHWVKHASVLGAMVAEAALLAYVLSAG